MYVEYRIPVHVVVPTSLRQLDPNSLLKLGTHPSYLCVHM